VQLLVVGIPRRLIRVLNRGARFIALSAVAVLMASGCSQVSGDSVKPTLSVTVSIEVCAGRACFIAGVPAAQVTVTDGASERVVSAITDEHGVLVIPTVDPGTYQISARWGDQETSTVTASVSSGGTSVTLRLPDAAETPGSR
jgi:hypothetical protein